ncbi:cell envelope biogenesis protein OmpA [Leptobacterium flavescens]|uniref:Cell envelope biogenesis protein OmpA n=1 Tax=Leptobacterium flavescens TaxID=472055 RepID=A0A6P0UPV9_9FLAO|nr:cell envelope biogenesis protein OmpA [Leptobacterium flavescens]NER12933.1 cell envelope biogenesis protein OmpA [Leptobacterium flavescens]
MNEDDKLNILKDILLTDDREYAESISRKIRILEEIIEQREKLSTKVDPIIDERLSEYTKSIPDTLGPTITKTLKKEIKNSKDQVVEALYPIMGKMIKKYIAQEIKLLTERINKQLENSFSPRSWKRRFKAWFGGVKEEELILSELSSARIEQVLLIEKDSGILLGSYSNTETIDKDMISGMLTAIKNFVEDAFNQGGQNLELIEYELYNIHIQSFVSYYIAVVVSGNYSTHFKNQLQDTIFNFSDNFLSLPSRESFDTETIEKELTYYFKNDIV